MNNFAEMIRPEERIRMTVDLFNILDRFARVELLGELEEGTRMIGAGTYEDEPFPINQFDETEIRERRKLELKQMIEVEIEERGYLPVTLFTCPNGDATRFSSDPSAVMPREFNSDQILYSRLPLLFYLWKQMGDLGIPFTMNIILGDTDFLSYYYPMIEEYFADDPRVAEELPGDLEDIVLNYTRSLFKLINRNLGNITVDMASSSIVGFRDINMATTAGSVNLISLLRNTTEWGSEFPSRDEFIDTRDLEEETFYTSRRCNNPRRFDQAVFGGKPIEYYRDAARIKIGNYRQQGRGIRKLGRILLIDELPPTLKARMLNTRDNGLFSMFPWIRSGDKWRDPASLNLIDKSDLPRVIGLNGR